MSYLMLAVVAYLCGSLTFGFWLARAVGGIDIREHGSRNVGATNVGRVLGKKWGLLCLGLDALKGLLPTLLLPGAFGLTDSSVTGNATVVAATATVLGHVFPVWLRFRGGKGVATAAGAAGVVSPWGLLAAVTAFGAVFGTRRIVSLASVIAAVTFAAVTVATGGASPFAAERRATTLFGLAVPALVVARHAKNIGRLRRGEEPAMRETSPSAPSTDGAA